MRKRLIVTFAVAGCLAWSPAHAQDEDDVNEYVRACDVYGAGFFYIPGTETCLQISGNVNYVGEGNPNRLGGGTVVTGGGENFLFSMPTTLHGAGVAGRMKIAADAAAPVSRVMFSFDYFNATGSRSGMAEVGTGGVSMIGLTFLEDQGAPFGTGVGTTTPGFGLTGSGRIESHGGAVELGGAWSVRDHFLARQEGERTSELFLTAALRFEQTRYKSRGVTEVTQFGVLVPGFLQRYDYWSRDNYVGVAVGLESMSKLTNELGLSFNASAAPLYHMGRGAITAETHVGGTPVLESFAHRRNGIAWQLSAGVSLDYAFASNAAVTIGVQHSWRSGVTSYTMPENPGGQPGRFSRGNVHQTRISAGLRASF